MLAEWLRERDQRREQAAVERAEAEARRAEAALRETRPSVARLVLAAAGGFSEWPPFDEPPPGGPYDENGADEA